MKKLVNIKLKNLSKINLILRMLNISRKDIIILFFASIGTAIWESLGVSLLYPVFQYMEKGEKIFLEVPKSLEWRIIADITSFFHLPYSLTGLLIICFFPVMLRQVFYYINNTYSVKIQFNAVAKLQTEGFNKMLNSDLTFFENTSRGGLLSIFTMESLRAGYVIFYSFQMLFMTVLLTGYLALMFYLSSVITILVLATFIIVELLIRKNIGHTKKYGDTISDDNEKFSHLINERLFAVKLVKLHNTQSHETELLRKISNDLATNQINLRKKNAAIQVTIEPALTLGMLAILLISINYLGMALSGFVMIFFVLMRMIPMAKHANAIRQEIHGSISGLYNILDIMNNAEKNKTIRNGHIVFNSLKHGIVFKNVDFYHTPSKPVLKDISLIIPAGKTTAIVGHSGVGKSTMIDLILRLRDVKGGEILLDNLPLREIDLETFHNSLGFVSQEPILFNDTIYNNVTYGLSGIKSEEEIENVLKISHCWEFIKKVPKGLQTIIGDNGMNLSGGERQRLCMARALLRKPSILLFDEPTSSLDAESEQYIQKTIKELKGNLTIIIIAHRLSTIMDADSIIVLEKGGIESVGSHDELMFTSNTYTRLFKIQSQQENEVMRN